MEKSQLRKLITAVASPKRKAKLEEKLDESPLLFHDLAELCLYGEDFISQISGMTKVEALRVREISEIFNDNTPTVRNKAMTDPGLVAEATIRMVKDKNKEHFFVVGMDQRNKIIGVELVSLGTLTASLVHPREVFAHLIKLRSAKAILVHNHPSGEVDPSEDDIKITKRLWEAGKIMGIEIIDHVILGHNENSYYSFKEHLLI